MLHEHQMGRNYVKTMSTGYAGYMTGDISSSIRILLIRHGETKWNRIHRFQGRIDVPLNQEGIAQAQALARALKNERLVAIYSNPLTRAMETARLVKRFHSRYQPIVRQSFALDFCRAQSRANERPVFSSP
jgi:broad specificity phosphatase PhoE